MTIAEGSKAESAGLKTLDVLAIDSYVTTNDKYFSGDKHLIDANAIVTFSDNIVDNVFAYMDLSSLKNYKNLGLNKFLTLYESQPGEGEQRIISSTPIDMGAKFISATVNFQTIVFEEETDNYHLTDHPIVLEKDSDGGFEDFGYSLYLDVKPPLSFGLLKKLGHKWVVSLPSVLNLPVFYKISDGVNSSIYGALYPST